MSAIKTKGLENDAVKAAKILIENNTALRARNAADSADVDLFKLNASDRLEFLTLPQCSTAPSTGNDLVNKTYADGLVSGGASNSPVVVFERFNNVTLATMPASVDGVSLTSGDRFAVGGQTTAGENGIYVFNGTGNAATRSTDANTASELEAVKCYVQSGTYAGNMIFQTNFIATLGTSAASFEVPNDAPVLKASDGTLLANFQAGEIKDASGLDSVLAQSRALKDAGGTSTVDWSGGLLNDASAVASLDWISRLLKDASGNSAIQYGSRQLVDTAGSTVVFDWSGSDNDNKTRKLINVVDPTSAQDAATKNYVDGKVPLYKKELFTLSGTNITNQYVDFTQVAKTDSVHAHVDGQPQGVEGASYDYTLSYTGGAGGKTRLSFVTRWATGGAQELVANDLLVVQYVY